MAAFPTTCRPMRLLFMLFTMASVGLPGTSGFVGEFLALVGAYEANSWVAAVATTGIILGAAYMLWLYWRVAYGTSAQRRRRGDARSRQARARACWRRSPRRCCGWASIPRASWRRCASDVDDPARPGRARRARRAMRSSRMGAPRPAAARRRGRPRADGRAAPRRRREAH